MSAGQRASKSSSAEQANEWEVRANEQMEERAMVVHGRMCIRIDDALDLPYQTYTCLWSGLLPVTEFRPI